MDTLATQISDLLTRRPVIFQFFRFACIGLMNTALNFLILNAVSKALKAAGWKIISAEIRYVAKNFTDVNGTARKEVTDFLNALDDHDDVHRVYAALK